MGRGLRRYPAILLKKSHQNSGGIRQMNLHGTLLANLQSALDSARRYRGKPLYRDTLSYWIDLVGHARHAADAEPDAEAVRRLIGLLEIELADRAALPGETPAADASSDQPE